MIESSLLEVNDGLQKLEQRINEATEIDKQLATAAEADGFFDVPKFFEVLLPSAEADHDKADEIAGSDPVQVVEQYIPLDGVRWTTRSRLRPRFNEPAKSRFPSSMSTHRGSRSWDTIPTGFRPSVRQLGAHANELFALAAERSVAAEAAELDQSLTALGNSCRTMWRPGRAVTADRPCRRWRP